MWFCKASSMHPAITHGHSHVSILAPSSAGADHGYRYETASNGELDR